MKGQMIKEKQNFKNSFFKMYCEIGKEWVIVSAETLKTYGTEEFKEKIIEGKAIINFYSIRILKFKPEY